jgi:hypothetical protein
LCCHWRNRNPASQAPHAHGNRRTLTCDISVLESRRIFGGGKFNVIFFQRIAQHFAANSEVDVLRQVAHALGDFWRVEFGDDPADDVAGLIEYRAAAVAAPGNLYLLCTVADADGRSDVAKFYCPFGVERALGRWLHA